MAPPRKFNNKTELQVCRNYKDGLSEYQLAKKYSTTQGHIHLILIRWNIERRTRANFGEKNGIFGKRRTQETKDKISKTKKERIKNGKIKVLSGENNGMFNHNGLQEMQQIAKEKGGKCLSTKYTGVYDKMEFRCKEGHIFETRICDIKSGHWCSHCLYKNEEEVRILFEKLFDAKFPKQKPKWLLNSKGNRMELDGYCEKLNIAFEYQGEQHYEFVPFFHKTKQRFIELQERDELKRKLCKENGVPLIIIPYYILKENRKDYIIDKYLGFKAPQPYVRY